MTYVISDLHGYPPEKFERLLKLAGFAAQDTCFVLGDAIDRGADGIRLLLWIMAQPNICFILGNHEVMMLSCKFLFDEITDQALGELREDQFDLLSLWVENGGEPTIKGLADLDRKTIAEIVEFLEESPLYEQITVNGEQYLLTHSGLGNFREDKPIEAYHLDELIWSRPSLHTTYYSNIMTVFGHTPTQYISPDHRGNVLFTDTWIDIDTGAAQGLAPTLLCLDNKTEYRLDASQG